MMKSGYKVIIAAAGLFLAGSAAAVEVVDISPAQWEQVSAASSGRLAEAAQNISAAVSAGDSGRAGELLDSVFSGSAGKASAAPVYASGRQAAAAPIAARGAAAVKGGFVPELDGTAYFSKSDYEIEPEEVDGEEGDGDDGEDADSAAGSADTEEEAATPPSPLWETMAAGMAGILVAMSFIALFPAAPLLLALGAAALLLL